jgi:hypothetical protein
MEVLQDYYVFVYKKIYWTQRERIRHVWAALIRDLPREMHPSVVCYHVAHA